MIKKLSILLAVVSSIVLATTLNFNGTSDYMSIADDPTFDVTTGLTVEAWVNKNAVQTGWRQVVTREKGTGIYDQWGLATNGTDWRGFINTTAGYSGNFSTSNPVTNGTWTHIALTFDGTDFSFYIDGALAYTTPNSGTLEAGSQPILVGAASNNNNVSHVEYFDGMIDEVRVWDYARTLSEIQSTMYCPPTGSESGLILYLKNNEGSGTSVADETANANNGTIASATWVTANESPAPSQSTAAGNWSASNTWLSGQVPANVNYNCVEINNAVTLNDASRTTGSLTMNAGSLTITGVTRATGGTLTVKNLLALTSGYIYTNSTNTLTLETTATTSGGSAASFVDGPLNRMTDSTNDYYFPIGDAIASPVYQPLSLQPPSATADTWTGESHATGYGTYGVFGTLAYVSTAEYWDLASANAAFPDSLKFWWSAHSAFVSQGIDESNLTIAHYVSGIGLWLEEGREDYSGIPSTTGWANTSPSFANSSYTFGKGTSLDNTDISDLPSDFGLSRIYPNPFNPVTSIEYELPSMENVNISIFNINGQLVSTLVNDIQEAGSHSISWNGNEQPSGTYFLRMTSGDHVDTQKLMLIK
ncbi:MAG: T9SS type A sorting domain-containing protein [FCB group bacterium]|nr:T9SS type A sorting domain-containing protein [FCB group bacterium]